MYFAFFHTCHNGNKERWRDNLPATPVFILYGCFYTGVSFGSLLRLTMTAAVLTGSGLNPVANKAVEHSRNMGAGSGSLRGKEVVSCAVHNAGVNRPYKGLL